MNNWCALPEPLLLCISRRLRSIVDYYAFAGTCSSWFYVAKYGRKAFMAAQPPLLCGTDGERLYSPLDGKCYTNRRLAAVLRRLRGTVLDVSHGYLVITTTAANCAAATEREIVLYNPFTVHEVGGLPRIPTSSDVDWVALTAPPTSPDCVVVACTISWSPHRRGWVTNLQYLRLGSEGPRRWIFFRKEAKVDYGQRKPVTAAGDGKVYLWVSKDSSLRLVAMEFLRDSDPNLTCLSSIVDFSEGRRVVLLAEPGGELLSICVSLDACSEGRTCPAQTPEVYQWDSSRREWVEKVDGLGNRAVFVDGDGRVAAADDVAGGWRRRGDGGHDVYYCAGSGPEVWMLRSNGEAAQPVLLAPFRGRKPAGHDRQQYPVVWLLPGDAFEVLLALQESRI